LYTTFTFCFSFVQDPYWGGALLLDPTGRLTSPRLPGHAPRREPPHCKILGTPGQPSDPPQPAASKGIPGDAFCVAEILGRQKKTKEMARGNLPFCFKGNN